MELLEMCRVCLADDVRMCAITNTHLEEIYESLTLMPLKTKDSRPVQVCYVCYAGLQNCYRLQKRCLQSEELLTQVLSSEMLLSINVEEIGTPRLTLVHPVYNLNMCDDIQKDSDNESFKDDATMPLDLDNSIEEKEIKIEGLEEPEIKIEKNDEFSDIDLGDIVVDVTAELDDDEDLIAGTAVFKKRRIFQNEPREAETEPECFDEVREESVVISDVIKTTNKIGALHQYCDNKVTAYEELKKQTFKTKKRSKTRVIKKKQTRTYTKRYKCKLCKKTYSYERTLKQHIQFIHVGEKPYKCDVCNKQFTDRVRLIRHYCPKIDGDRFECDVCQKIFSRKNSLEKHIYIHYDRKTYSCNLCKKSYTDLKYYNKHILKHNTAKPYPCDECKMRFELKSLLDLHTRRVHSDEKPFQCSVCGKCFILESYLNNHMQLHSGKKPYACESCNKCFATSHYLYKHMDTHLKNKSYQCDICKQWLKNAHNLRLHKLTHLTVRPFECQMCGKCFKSKTNLKRHHNIHTGEESYQCDVCKKSFNQKGNWKTHMRTHTGEKLFSCDVCKKSFKQKSSLRNHIADYENYEF